MSHAGIAPDKLASKTLQKKASLQACVTDAEESLSVEKTHAKCLERKYAVEAEKGQQLLAKHQKASQAVSCQVAEYKCFLKTWHSMIVTVTAGMTEWRGMPTEAAEELKVAQAGVALQSALGRLAREMMGTQVV